MKVYIALLALFSLNSYALSENWTNASCALSASRYLSDEFVNPYELPTRLNLHRSGHAVEMVLKSDSGVLKRDSSLIETQSQDPRFSLFKSKRHTVEIGIIGSVRTEIKIYKSTAKKELLAYLLCHAE